MTSTTSGLQTAPHTLTGRTAQLLHRLHPFEQPCTGSHTTGKHG
ncbi:hypothetical protein ACIBAC_42605 [Streptomyces sp. NPDC051362]